jgi:hypothetical protein
VALNGKLGPFFVPFDQKNDFSGVTFGALDVANFEFFLKFPLIIL